MSKSQKIKIFLKLLFASCLIYWFLHKNDLSKIINSIASLPVYIYLFAVVLIFLAVLLNSGKWLIILPGYNIIKLFELNLIAQYYGLILPGQLLGDGAKAYILSKDKIDTGKIWVSVLFDKVTGIVGLLLVGVVGLIFSSKGLPAWFIWNFIIIICVCFIVLLLMRIGFFYNILKRLINNFKLRFNNNKTIDFLSKLIDAWFFLSKKDNILLFSILLGIIYQVLGILINISLAKAFGINVSFFDWCWIQAVVSVLLLLPLTIGGIGIREGSLIGFLGWFGVSAEKALALSFSIFGLQILLAIVGGILDYKLGIRRRKS
jgi:uncharacterized protein (TIRG00374 family)